MCAGVIVLWVGILLGGGAGSSATAQSGPSKLVEPFVVVDKTGNVLFKVASASGTGIATVNDNKGNAQVVLGSPPGSPKPQIQILSPDGNPQLTLGSPAAGIGHIRVLAPDGSLKAGMGVTPEGHGLVRLNGGAAKTSLVLVGNGILGAKNAQDKQVVSLGVSGFGGGDLHLYNSSGTSVVGIFSEQGQTGIVQLFNAAGQERVTLGTLTTGKGDVCASGDKGQLCLGRLNPKY